MCDAATRGIWADLVNSMMSSNTYFVEGTLDQLSRLCRCRRQQMEIALLEIKQFEIADVTDAHDMHRIESRRRRRERTNSDLKRKAASARWSKRDADTHAPSASAYASAYSGKGSAEGKTNGVELPEGFPTTEQEAREHAPFVGCQPEFASLCWNKAMSRGGMDAKSVPIRSFRNYLATEMSYDKDRIEREKHYGTNKTNSRNGSPRVEPDHSKGF